MLTEVGAEFAPDAVRAASPVPAASVSRRLGGVLLGALGDRHGHRTAMTAGTLLFSLGTPARGPARGYGTLHAARLVAGLGTAGECSASATYAMERRPERARCGSTSSTATRAAAKSTWRRSRPGCASGSADRGAPAGGRALRAKPPAPVGPVGYVGWP
ncbi:MFS transporter [Kitasatospora phosalacinea]|uniref:MFS transporter n=1 Tax=Kitasatospora phosalacinea TaxID=2065 RepID=UPI0005271312|nr:MFS transporter [Kitasatospora phosalacinea]